MTKPKKLLFDWQDTLGFKIAEGIQLRKNPLLILSDKFNELSETVSDLMRHADLASRDDAAYNAAAIVLMIDGELVEAGTRLTGVEADLVIEQLAQLRHRYVQLMDDAPAVPSILESATQTLVKKQIRHVRDIDHDTVHQLVHITWLEAIAGKHGDTVQQAFSRISQHLDLGREDVINELVEILVKIKNEPRFGGLVGQLAEVPTTQLDEFAYLAGQVNAFKGKLMEKWFYSHPFWTDYYASKLLEKAQKRARQLSTAKELFKPQIITTPLKLNNKEIYDGVVVVVKQLPGGDVHHLEGFIDTAIEIKSELKSSFLTQAENSVIREHSGTDFILAFQAQGKTNYLTVRADPNTQPLRVFVAPHVPEESQWLQALIPGQATMIQSPLTADDTKTILQTLIEAMAKIYPT